VSNEREQVGTLHGVPTVSGISTGNTLNTNSSVLYTANHSQSAETESPCDFKHM